MGKRAIAVGREAVSRHEAPLGASPEMGGSVRPGPAVLYADPPAAPQLENRSDWFRAAPLLVSGTEAYDRGEYCRRPRRGPPRRCVRGRVGGAGLLLPVAAGSRTCTISPS